MKKINFSIDIDAPKELVWKILWNADTYGQWTSVFCAGSYMESDWKEGGKTRFLSPGGSGMYSTIDRLVPNEMVSFRHLGEIKEGVEISADSNSEVWGNAHEDYYLSEKEGKTALRVEMDITEEYASYFREKFPDGLQKVKELSETNNSD